MVGYDPSRMLAPRTQASTAADVVARFSAGASPGPQHLQLPRGVADAAAAQPMDPGARGGSGTSAGKPAALTPCAAGSGSSESYQSSELVQRLRDMAGRAAPLFAAAEAILQRAPAPASPDVQSPDGAEAAAGDAVYWRTPEAAGTASEYAAAKHADGGNDAMRLQLLATPSPTSSKENEGSNKAARAAAVHAAANGRALGESSNTGSLSEAADGNAVTKAASAGAEVSKAEQLFSPSHFLNRAE